MPPVTGEIAAEARRFFSTLAPFADLPEAEQEAFAGRVSLVRHPKDTLLADQSRTRIDRILVIRAGAVELFYARDGEKTLGGRLGVGEIFGGISVLMNAGMAVRTARTVSDAEFYALPAEVFHDLAARYPAFKAHFTEVFRQRMEDQSYAAIVIASQARDFLAATIPFTFLAEADLELAVAALSLSRFAAGTVLFVQGQSRIEHLYIFQKGAAELYFEQGGQKNLKGYLSEGDTYGGISMLLNKGVSIRTLRIEEEAYVFTLPRPVFTELCARCRAFSEFFTDTFGKRMLDRSYAEIFARRILPKDETLHIFNLSVERLMTRDVLSCPAEVSVQEAAALMSRSRCSSILVQGPGGQFVGIVTDTDLRDRVLAAGLPASQPVGGIMSTPLTSVASQTTVFEAMIVMMRGNLKHLAITGPEGQVVGTVTNRDLLTAQGQSPLFIVREIHSAGSLRDVQEKPLQLPGLVQSLINNGAKAENVTRLISTVSDAVLTRLLEFALAELGPAPVPFVFMVMGSEGRHEQTLKTDQDNAIVFEDPAPGERPAAQDYFLRLGEKVCTWLDEAGYAFCQGGVMARNPAWCQPLSVWQEKFTEWIHAAQGEDLLYSSIFFDFRGAFGDLSLIDRLRRHLFASLEGWAGFFRHLTENALHFKPPLGFLRNFVVESKGEHRNKFDIKRAMLPIVDFARIHALKHGVAETNTFSRLRQLQAAGVLAAEEFGEIENAYSYLMQLRFLRQITAIIQEGAPPDNYINPKKLTRIEQTMLKEIFKRIENFQTKMSFEFTGQ